MKASTASSMLQVVRRAPRLDDGFTANRETESVGVFPVLTEESDQQPAEETCAHDLAETLRAAAEAQCVEPTGLSGGGEVRPATQTH